MKWKRKCAPLVLLCGLALAFPDPCLGEKGGKSVSSVVDDEALSGVKVELVALFARVQEAKLPPSLFEAKAREGIVKKVPPEKIVAALEALEKRCIKVSELLVKAGLKATDRKIELGASLLASGMSEKDVEKLLVEIGSGKLDASHEDKALLISLVLVETGTEGTKAADTVMQLIRSKGQKGIDSWFEKNKGQGKGKKPGKPPGKGKAKGKPAKPHAK